MSDVLPGPTVTRWKRYGKDRLYVTAADGTKVGYWDLVTDVGSPDSPESASALHAAVTAWKADQHPVDTGGGEVLESSPVIAEVEGDRARPANPPTAPDLGSSGEAAPVRPWIDLATNAAGAEAREQALAARDEAPVKTFLARALGLHTNERAWRIGAVGEEKVATQLVKVAKKDPRWRFLHSIPVGNRDSDIDHLVVGPGGVFTVNAKHHPGGRIWVGGNTFLVNGTKQPYIRNSRHEAARATRLLTEACGFPVLVEGLVVTVNADDVTVKNPPAGVSVVPRMQVAKWLLRHGDILADQTVDAIFDAARRSTTWKT
jgi:hypothetical protein